MLNTFAWIDHHAACAESPWHHAGAAGKLLFTALVVALAVTAPSWRVLLVLLALVLAMAASARLPWRLLLAAALAPLFFGLLFVLARGIAAPGELARLAMRPVVSSLAALWLVGSTPYPDLFAPVSRVLPRALGDGLFLTYRAVFVLFARVERMQRALFLRGGLHGPVTRRAGMLGEALGTVVLSGFERSHRLYQAMLLRGHSGRICGSRHGRAFTRADVPVLVAALVAVGASLWWWGSGSR